MSLRGTKQSHVEKPRCKVRDCFVPRNNMFFLSHLIYTIKKAVIIITAFLI